MIEIENFLQQCKLGQSAFIVEPYNTEEINTEIGKIYFYIKKCDVKNIIDFWKTKDKNKYLELEHPLHKSINTRAVFSLNKHIFFVDEGNKYPWVLFQSRNIFDCILVDGKIYTFPGCYGMIDFRIFNNLDQHSLKYRDIEFYFCLGGANFWHFFYEQLLNIYEIKPKRLFCLETNYFTPLYYQKMDYKSNKVLVYPHTISGGRILNSENRVLDILMNPRVGYKIYHESMLSCAELESHNDSIYDLKIWLSLVYRNNGVKTWINQEEAIVSSFKEICKRTKYKIKIYIDGFKSYENNQFREVINENMLSSIMSKLSDLGCIVVSLHGVSLKQAIYYCSDVDFAICEAGSGAIVPIFCCKKPSIIYGNSVYINRISKSYYWFDKVIAVDCKQVSEVDSDLDKWPGARNYHIKWQHIFDLMLKTIYAVKNIKSEKVGIEIKSLSFQTKYDTAKTRIQNQLSYKLGQAMIVNSKSMLGYIRMPFVLSYIKDKHKQEQKIYQEKIKKDPSLKLTPLENYPDYQEALKLKNHLSYKLGQILIQANKAWYKGGYVKMWFKIIELKKKIRRH